jgi:tetratricopeptide (TPR) repeat protein
MSAAERTIFVSRAGADAPMAAEVGRILEASGYSVILQQWDFANQNFMAKMHESLAGGARVIALLSPEYLASDHCSAEWQNSIAGDPLNSKGRLIVLRVVECEPPGLLAGIAYWDMLPALGNPAMLAELVCDAVRTDRRDASPSGTYWRGPRAILDNEAIRPTPSFTGREDVLAASAAAFAGGAEVVALHGLGGVGKTTLAGEYAWRAREQYAVAWRLAAENEDGIIADLVRLGAVLVRGFDKVENQRAAAQQVTSNLLSGFAKPVLLVFDNLEDERLLHVWRPAQGTRALITSRTSSWGGDVVPISLHTWSAEDAARYLRRESGRSDLSEADAHEIAEILGGLPLALAHAAAYLKATRTVTPRAYVARISRYLAQAPRGADYKRAVFATFQTAITKAEEEAPGAAAVLCLASFFASAPIADELLRQSEELYDVPAPMLPGAAQEASALRSTLADLIFTDEAIGALDRLSLVDYSLDTQSLSVHRLVQATGRDLVGAQAGLWLEVAIAVIDAAFPKVDFANWAACERLLPHAQAVAQRALDAQAESLPLARVLHNTAAYLTERARYSEAQRLLERALAIRERALGPEHLDVADSLTKQGVLFVHEAQYAAALALFERVLAIRERALGPEHADFAETLNNLAFVAELQGRDADAETLHKRALAIRERALGPAHPDVAISLNNVAIMCRKKARYDEAEPLYLQALSIFERAHGQDHPDAAYTLNNLGWLYLKLERFAEAEAMHQRALSRRERALGPEHPDVAWSLNSLAALYREQGRYAEAEPAALRSLAIRERVLGPDHAHVASSLVTVASIWRDQKRYAEAQPLLERALAIRELAVGADHPEVVANRATLAEIAAARTATA